MKNFRKLGALLLVLCLAVALLPTAALAEVTDVDEGQDPGITINRYYKTNVKMTFAEYDGDGTFVKDLENVLISLDVASDDEAVDAAVAEALAEKEPAYTVTRTGETTEVLYSAPQVTNAEGDVPVFGDLDDLVNAYIAGGKVSSTLDITMVTTITQKYKVVKRAAGSVLLSGISISGLDAPVAGAAPDTTCTITTDPAGGVEAYEVRWVHVNGGDYDWDWTGTFQAGEYYYASISITLKDTFRAKYEGADTGGLWTGTATIEGLEIDSYTSSATKSQVFLPTTKIKVAGDEPSATPAPTPTPDPAPSPAPDEPSPVPAGPTSPATGVGDTAVLWVVLCLCVIGAAVVLPRRKEQ